MTKERWIVVVSIMMCILGCVCFWLVQKNIHKEQQTKTEEKSIYKTLSESDKKAADIYAKLYEESAENVSRIYQKTNDWEKTNKQLEKQFFTIDENMKYEMQKGTDRKKGDGVDSGKRKSLGQSEVVRCGKERGAAGGRNDRGSEIKKT